MKTYRVTFTLDAPEECETPEEIFEWNDISLRNLKASIGPRNRDSVKIEEIEQ